MILSKKQLKLFNDITSPNVPRISVLGSTQSGKTHCIDFSIIPNGTDGRMRHLNSRYPPVSDYRKPVPDNPCP